MNADFAQIAIPARHFDVMLSPTPRGARLARLLGKAWLCAWGLPPGISETAEHVVAELATNAATHARVPGRSFLLALTATPNLLRVEVTDTCGDVLPVPVPQPAPAESESGRGLLLVEALADRWGVTEGPAPRKTVWAELDLVREPWPTGAALEPRSVTARTSLTTPLTFVPVTATGRVGQRPERRTPPTADSKAALVVIDMQNGFLNDHTRHVLPTIEELATAWGQAGLPVVFTRYHNYPGSPYERHLGWSRLQEPPETEIAAELAGPVRKCRAVIDKKTYSFLTPEVEALAASEGWTDLVLCGIATDCCVLKSAVDAFERGFAPWIVTDACASDGGTPAHDAGLLVAARAIGEKRLVTGVEVLQRFAGEVR